VSPSNSAETVARAPLRWRRRTALVVALVFCIIVGWWLFARWAERHAWYEACAEADRLDPGWRWDDLVASLPDVPDAKDSAVHVHAARQMLPLSVRWRHSDPNWEAIWLAHYQTVPPLPSPPEVIDGLRRFLSAHQSALDEARGLADCADGRPTLPQSPVILGRHFFPVEVSMVCRDLLDPLVALQAGTGQLDDALVAVRAMLYASRPLARAAFYYDLDEILSARSVAAEAIARVLSQGEPSRPALDAISRLFVEEAERPLWLASFRGRRAIAQDTVRAYDEGRLTARQTRNNVFFTFSDWRAWTRWHRVNEILNGLADSDFRRSHAVATVRHLTWIVERLKESPDGLTTAAAEWAALRRELPSNVREFMDALAENMSAERAQEASFRCAVAGLVAERFRRDSGRWPAAVADLVPDYLAKVPRDPFDGEPLRLIGRADGIVIYSLGNNGTDDGGADVDARFYTGRDVGIRLWDVDKRRQPPMPPGPPEEGQRGR
jgi:hypothetical protein